MTVLEKKALFIKSVLDESVDEFILEELDLFFKSLKQKRKSAYPCQYSIQELRQGIERSVEQIDDGFFFTHDEVKVKHNRL